tara:strand:+ start:897 stop:1259 length:363 start_codon:yes stop_codon:yes gene_type:complete
MILMTMIERLGEFEVEKAKKALQMLLIDSRNEFNELANAMSIPTSTPDYELIILRYCIDFHYVYRAWSERNYPTDNITCRNAMSLVRQISMTQTSMIQITHMMNIAHDLYRDFLLIYKRI